MGWTDYARCNLFWNVSRLALRMRYCDMWMKAHLMSRMRECLVVT